MPTHSLDFDYGDKTIQEFVLLFKNGQLNLEPGFQRDSVWTLLDRKKLIESLLQNYPIPSVFLYRQNENGKLRYDIIDGKQRIETILMFQGTGYFRGHRFSAKLRLGHDDGIEEWDWQRIQKRGHEHRLMGYKFQTVEITGDLSDIIDLFVRINSTGKRLTGAEKRHARFFRSDFLKQAGRLAEKRHRFFLENRILSAGQISRMKHIELVCELMASIQAKGLINKKKALDGIIGGQSSDHRTLRKAVKETIRILNLVKRMFPDIKTTRFANSADFYSLFVLIWEMDLYGCILSDAKRNRQAQKFLVWLSNGVGIVRQQQRKAEGASTDQRLFADYLLTVQGDTDSLATRQRRAEILKKYLAVFSRRRMSNVVLQLNNVDFFGTQKIVSDAQNAKGLFRGRISRLTTSSLMHLVENQVCLMLLCCAGHVIREKGKNNPEQGAAMGWSLYRRKTKNLHLSLINIILLLKST